MNSDRIEGAWKQLVGTIRTQWAELTDDDLARAEGSWERLSGAIQSRYGRGKDAVESEIRDFRREHESLAVAPHAAT